MAPLQAPDTHYAQRPDGVNIGYQVFGSGPAALVFCWGWMSHLDLQWTDPGLAHFFERLAAFSRVIVYDKPGTGVSDPILHVPTLEERVDDIRLVLDAAGVHRAAILGESEAGPAAAMFAATYPHRTDALIIYGSIATGQPEEQELAAYGGSAAELDDYVAQLRDSIEHWGEGRSADWIVPSIVSPLVRRAFGTFERSAVSPTMARGLIDALLQIDIRDALSAISAPTLVLHRLGDVVPVAHGRLLASRIPGARLVELSGSDHAIFTQDAEKITGEIEQLLTGKRAVTSPDRVLASVLFTDIVDSTRRAAEAGDTVWRGVLERHDALVKNEVQRSGGRVVKTLGDGVLAVFPGPARAIECAQTLLLLVADLGLQLRAGVHTGECEVIGDDVAGMAVHIGARVAGLAGADDVLVTRTVVDLVVGSGLHFVARGEYKLKGVPGTWSLFAVSGQSERNPVEPSQAHMTSADKVTVRVARHAPRLMRAVGRLSQRRARESASSSPPT